MKKYPMVVLTINQKGFITSIERNNDIDPVDCISQKNAAFEEVVKLNLSKGKDTEYRQYWGDVIEYRFDYVAIRGLGTTKIFTFLENYKYILDNKEAFLGKPLLLYLLKYALT